MPDVENRLGPSHMPIGTEMSPVALVEDRYRGSYSGGNWIAIAVHFEKYLPGFDRLHFVLHHDDGPFSDDPDARNFWGNIAPGLNWIAVGASPDQAIANLRLRYLGA
ncbi:hypothetical protein LGM43_26670 [Burkholderia seminalis]|uniref:hypothetical protein n=1 Tax=Burkholderia seminalis TaxID=488731 RepID=UPI001CF5EF0D|nr:hypothetical protein [Burkholderia seminalis]MCA7953857.1 hypothetical protein [Burkholderia seminalis]